MTSREQMVEKAAEAAWRTDAADAFTITEGHVLDAAVGADRYRLQARASLDAILPQVTTVAELEALPEMALTVNPGGGAQTAGNAARSVRYLGDGAVLWPLTVVWQPDPEVTP